MHLHVLIGARHGGGGRKVKTGGPLAPWWPEGEVKSKIRGSRRVRRTQIEKRL